MGYHTERCPGWVELRIPRNEIYDNTSLLVCSALSAD